MYLCPGALAKCECEILDGRVVAAATPLRLPGGLEGSRGSRIDVGACPYFRVVGVLNVPSYRVTIECSLTCIV
jgi:hypothetical protein